MTVTRPDDVLDAASATDVGTGREANEDCCAVQREGDACVLAAVADGVSSAPGGEVASAMAVEAVLREFREHAPAPAAQRIYRAVQQANIEVYDRSIAVPELRGMSTTLVTAVVEGGVLTAVHVGDSRLYVLRGGSLTQLTKDHSVAAERARLGLMSKERARTHADRSVLTRSLGRELIVSRDRITEPVQRGDVLLLCSDGLYNVLDDAELAAHLTAPSADDACRALLAAANARGTPDNLSAAVIRVVGDLPEAAPPVGLGGALRRLLGRG